MKHSIVITGASKGIGRAAAGALAASGWDVIGVTRETPANFPGVFMVSALNDRQRTAELGSMLAERGDVLGIVNNLGIAKHEVLGAVELGEFSSVMDLNVRPALQLTQALLPGMRKADLAGS